MTDCSFCLLSLLLQGRARRVHMEPYSVVQLAAAGKVRSDSSATATSVDEADVAVEVDTSAPSVRVSRTLKPPTPAARGGDKYDPGVWTDAAHTHYTLDNGLLRVVVNPRGELASVVDQRVGAAGREVLAGVGNELLLHDDVSV